MKDVEQKSEDRPFRLRSGAVVKAGAMREDLPFLTRSLRFLLMPEGERLRGELGVRPGEIGVLCVVAENPGISQNDLALSLVLKKSAVTKVVQSLEADGLIERRRSRSDKRSNELRLTPAGTRRVTMFRKRSRILHDEWFDGIAAEDRAVFFSVLFTLVARLAERDAGGQDDL